MPSEAKRDPSTIDLFENEEPLIIQPENHVPRRSLLAYGVSRLFFFSYNAGITAYSMYRHANFCVGLENVKWGLLLCNWNLALNTTHQSLELLPLYKIAKNKDNLSEEQFNTIKNKYLIFRNIAATLSFVMTVLNYSDEINQIQNNQWEDIALQPGLLPFLGYLIDMVGNNLSFGAERLHQVKQWVAPSLVTLSCFTLNSISLIIGGGDVQCNPYLDKPFDTGDPYALAFKWGAGAVITLATPLASIPYRAVVKKCKKKAENKYYAPREDDDLSYPNPEDESHADSTVPNSRDSAVINTLHRESSQYHSLRDDLPRVSKCAQFMSFLKNSLNNLAASCRKEDTAPFQEEDSAFQEEGSTPSQEGSSERYVLWR